MLCHTASPWLYHWRSTRTFSHLVKWSSDGWSPLQPPQDCYLPRYDYGRDSNFTQFNESNSELFSANSFNKIMNHVKNTVLHALNFILTVTLGNVSKDMKLYGLQ